MQSLPDKIKIIISGGGTGGHVFPAIAIANAIKEIHPGAEILFVGAKGRLEMERVPAAGYKIIGLDISGFHRKLTLKNFSVLLKVLRALREARKIIKDFSPDVVVGVGGYASGPLVRAASRHGIPALLQEQNSYPGITNKILASRAKVICVAYEGMEKYFPRRKIILTGNPVRQDIVNLNGKKEEALTHFGLNAGKPVLLVLGGSLGARTLNESIGRGLPQLWENGIQLIWQTGKAFSEQAEELIKPYADAGMRTYPFISRMDLAYSLADVVVSRAGAITISELCIVQKPAILVPSPNVAEDHQTRNAMALVNREAAIMIKDNEASEKLVKSAVELIKNPGLREQLSVNIAKLAKTDAAAQIAERVIELALEKKHESE